MNAEKLKVARALVRPAPTAAGLDTCYICSTVIGDEERFVAAILVAPDGKPQGYYFCASCYVSGRVTKWAASQRMVVRS